MNNSLVNQINSFVNQNKYDVLEILFAEFQSNVIRNEGNNIMPVKSNLYGWRLFLIKEYDGDYCIIYTLDGPRFVYFLNTDINNFKTDRLNLIITNFRNTSLKTIKGESLSILNNTLSLIVHFEIGKVRSNQRFSKPINFKLGYTHPELKGLIKS
ncbi:hypothetical protein VOI54_00755 [Tamlana sp. 2201CG12-4]|uniref:hypothetical protein n=1 Tax=Tamlana sp. 2201CG12-4 TaxID=3112582 RepID=UPI002DBE5821|nr:hypothetical protein [Tamlana sp. 2201CG12-4]MEC3905537.1 hypothetical protein [Tamlana sp. 2201CG12-4]